MNSQPEVRSEEAAASSLRCLATYPRKKSRSTSEIRSSRRAAIRTASRHSLSSIRKLRWFIAAGMRRDGIRGTRGRARTVTYPRLPGVMPFGYTLGACAFPLDGYTFGYTFRRCEDFDMTMMR